MAEQSKLEIKLHHDLSRKITEQVVAFKTDLGIVINPVRHPDLLIHDIAHDNVKIWRTRVPASTTDLQNRNAVMICDPSLRQSQEILAALKNQGIQFKRIIESSSLEVITELCAQGTGLAIIPQRIVDTIKETLWSSCPTRLYIEIGYQSFTE